MDDKWLKSSFYGKGPRNLTFQIIQEEVEKNLDLIKRGDHPDIGYVDRSQKGWKITDAWWMK